MKRNLQAMIVKRVFFMFFLSLVTIVSAHGQKNPPKQVRYLYSNKVDRNISDDFNSIDWTNKWTWRRGMGDSSQVQIVMQTDTFVSIKGNAATKLGAGLSSLHTTKYGFYVTKWRLRGIKDGVKTPWHPSIWAAVDNFGVRNYKLDPKPYQRLEIDFMEAFWVPNWSSHVICWEGNKTKVHYPRPKSPQMPTKEWSVLGFEYTPEYIAFWEFKDNDWQFIQSVPFTEGKTVIGKQINYGYRQKVYWILSNIYIKNKETASPDTYLDVDYFYYYPFTFYPNYYWKD